MSVIRRQSLLSTLVIYAGFAVGLFNTYLFTKQGLFSQEEFGLYNAFLAIATLLTAAANLGAPYFIYKFYPYYRDRSRPAQNDQLSIALLLGGCGLLLAMGMGLLLEPLVIRKYATNAPQLVNYYHWTFLLGAGLLLFNILEAWNWQQQRAATSHFLKEAAWRLGVLLLIACFAWGWVSSYDLFIKLFSGSYLLIGLLLLGILLYRKQAPLALPFSDLSKRLRSPLIRYTSFTYAGTLIFTLAQVFDTILIASVLGNAMAQLALYSLAQNIASLLQVPQRGVVAASMAPLSGAWKQKNLQEIGRIYKRSSINQLIAGAGLLALVALNYRDAVVTFQLKAAFLEALPVLLLLGATRLIDMGTGINSQIIVTSPRWRFEFYSGMILLLLMLPLSYVLTRAYGITGTAWAQLISMGCYNLIRLLFLWKQYRLQPFSTSTLVSLLWALACAGIAYWPFASESGWWSLTLRSLLFTGCFLPGIYWFKLSPDINAVVQNVRHRLLGRTAH